MNARLVAAARAVAAMQERLPRAQEIGGDLAVQTLRRQVAEHDPLRFALTYLPHHLKEIGRAHV